jgi:hypothetical protein
MADGIGTGYAYPGHHIPWHYYNYVDRSAIMSPGKGKCYIFVDEAISDPVNAVHDLTDGAKDYEPDLQVLPSRRRRRSFIASLMRRAGLRDPHEVVEICVGEQQRTHPVEIPDADLIIVSWDAANGDGGRGSDQTLQFFATEGRSRLNEALNPYSGHGAVLFCEFQSVQGLPVQAAYDAIFGAGEVTVLKQTLNAGLRSGKQARPAKFLGRCHPMVKGYEWPMRQAFASNVPNGRQLQLFAPDRYVPPDESTPVDNNPLIHYRRDSLWFGWFTEWRRGWIPILVADFSSRSEVEYLARPEVPAILLAKKSGRGYVLASTLWLAGMPAVGTFLKRLQDPGWEEIDSFYRRVHRLQFLKDLFSSFLMLAIAVALSIIVVQVTLTSTAGSSLHNIVLGSGLTVISIVNICVFRGWRYLWKRPYGIGVLRWLLYPFRKS